MTRISSQVSFGLIFNQSDTGPNPYTGTTMLFAQAAAPTGWTKVTTYDDSMLRIVNGTVGNGGTLAFSTALTSTYLTPTGSGTATSTVGAVALTTSQIPGHYHPGLATFFTYNGTRYSSLTTLAPTSPQYPVAAYATGVPTTQIEPPSPGSGGQPHTHPGDISVPFTGSALGMDVKYIDCIFAKKN